MTYGVELEFAKGLAKEAGQTTLRNFSLNTETTWKEDSTPLTKTDIEINNFVIESIQNSFPNDGVLGEEGSFEQGRDRLWVLDPIDGTQPFTLGAPLSTFCLSLVIDGQPELGIIYDPYLDRMYWAAKNIGAFLNDRQLKVSDTNTLAQSYVVLSSRMSVGRPTTGELFDAIEKKDGKSFNFRSFAYGSTYVAAGTAVGAVIGVPKPWDVAATKIIIEEAGGRVTDLNGNDRRYDSDGDGLIASNGHVHDILLELVAKSI